MTARVVAVVEPRRTPHRMLLIRALVQNSARTSGGAVVVDLDPEAEWTQADLGGLVASRVVGEVDGTVAAWWRAWVEGEPPEDLDTCVWRDENSALVPGSLRSDDFAVRLGEGISRRAYAITPAAHLRESMQGLSEHAALLVLTCGPRLDAIARLVLSAADEAIVLVEPDRHVSLDMERVRSVVAGLPRADGHRSEPLRVTSVWFDSESTKQLVRRRRVGRASQAELDLRLRLPAEPEEGEVLGGIRLQLRLADVPRR